VKHPGHFRQTLLPNPGPAPRVDRLGCRRRRRQRRRPRHGWGRYSPRRLTCLLRFRIVVTRALWCVTMWVECSWCAGKSGRRRSCRRRRRLMLATLQRMLRRMTGRQRAPAPAGSMGKLAGRRRREAWAESLQQLLDRASAAHRFLSSATLVGKPRCWCGSRWSSVSPRAGGDPIIAQRDARDLQRRFSGHSAP
jgi:hypothetical protein